jgi:hypothetical protein
MEVLFCLQIHNMNEIEPLKESVDNLWFLDNYVNFQVALTTPVCLYQFLYKKNRQKEAIHRSRHRVEYPKEICI